jgi:hypothetical protein
MLAPMEKPAAILQRRLSQAGYDLSDDIDTTRQDELTFLVKFVYKSILLGPAVRVSCLVDKYVVLTYPPGRGAFHRLI